VYAVNTAFFKCFCLFCIANFLELLSHEVNNDVCLINSTLEVLLKHVIFVIVIVSETVYVQYETDEN